MRMAEGGVPKLRTRLKARLEEANLKAREAVQVRVVEANVRAREAVHVLMAEGSVLPWKLWKRPPHQRLQREAVQPPPPATSARGPAPTEHPRPQCTDAQMPWHTRGRLCFEIHAAPCVYDRFW